MYQCPAALERGSDDLFRIYDDPAQLCRACGGDVARNGETAGNRAKLRLKRCENQSARAGPGMMPHGCPRFRPPKVLAHDRFGWPRFPHQSFPGAPEGASSDSCERNLNSRIPA
jgi:hypothetical protein